MENDGERDRLYIIGLSKYSCSKALRIYVLIWCMDTPPLLTDIGNDFIGPKSDVRFSVF